MDLDETSLKERKTLSVAVRKTVLLLTRGCTDIPERLPLVCTRLGAAAARVNSLPKGRDSPLTIQVDPVFTMDGITYEREAIGGIGNVSGGQSLRSWCRESQ